MDQAETLVGVVSVIPEFGWSDHVGQLRLLVDPAHRSQGSCLCAGPETSPARGDPGCRRP